MFVLRESDEGELCQVVQVRSIFTPIHMLLQ